MAKKKGKFEFSKLGDLMQDLSKKIPIVIADDKEDVDKKFLDTGIYILNAALSGDLYKGIQSNRITVFAGDSGVGKSFLCYSTIAKAQKDGWNTIYIDTEFSIEKEQLPNYGIDIDPNRFQLIRANIVEDIVKLLTQTLDELKEAKKEGYELPPTILVIDSVGMLASRKESEDAKSGKETVDMTRAKKLASLFRIVSGDLGYLNMPLICTNHVYDEIGLFPKKIMKGGCLVEGNQIRTEEGLVDIKNINVGDYVETLNGYEEVLETHTYEKERIIFEFENGDKITCSKEHKFLVENEFTYEESWKTASNLEEGDSILVLDEEL